MKSLQANWRKWLSSYKKGDRLTVPLFVKNNILKFHKKYIGNIENVWYNTFEVIVCIMYLLLMMRTESEI